MPLPLTENISLLEILELPMNPPKVATSTKTIRPTMIEEPVEDKFFLIFDIADIIPKKNAPLRRVFNYTIITNCL